MRIKDVNWFYDSIRWLMYLADHTKWSEKRRGIAMKKADYNYWLWIVKCWAKTFGWNSSLVTENILEYPIYQCSCGNGDFEEVYYCGSKWFYKNKSKVYETFIWWKGYYGYDSIPQNSELWYKELRIFRRLGVRTISWFLLLICTTVRRTV